MPSFTTRVELHKAVETDYENLHSEMAKEGFSRTITSDDKVTYHLPTAEYNLIDSNLTRANVLEKAKKAAKKTGKENSIIVTESNGRTWHNLDAVK
jgi:hypothetical protein